jgi:hypothetical protein
MAESWRARVRLSAPALRRRGHEGAKVHGPQGFKVAQAGCGTQVALEKPGELGDVSQVGVESMWADLAFDAQMIGPARKGAGGIGGGLELVECGFGSC